MKTDKDLYLMTICQLILWREFDFTLGFSWTLWLPCDGSPYVRFKDSCIFKISECYPNICFRKWEKKDTILVSSLLQQLAVSFWSLCSLVAACWSLKSSLGAKRGKVSWFFSQYNLRSGSLLFKNSWFGILWTHWAIGTAGPFPNFLFAFSVFTLLFLTII